MTPLDPLLRELGREHRAQSAPAAVERALMAEFRRRHSRRFVWMALASATALAAALAFVLLQPPPPATLALRVAAPPAPAVRFTPKPPPMRAKAARPRPRPASPLPERAPAATPEIATDFFPLRPGPVLAPGELAQVVRARISRRELRRFGLDAADLFPVRYLNQDVRADVVFGYDGTARAIRFVRDSY